MIMFYLAFIDFYFILSNFSILTDISFSVVAADTDIYSKLTHKIEIKMTKYQFNSIRLSLDSKLSIMHVKL